MQTLRGKSVGFPEMEKGYGCTLVRGVGVCCGAHLPNPKDLNLQGKFVMTLQPRLDHMAPVLDVGALGHSHSFLTRH